MASEVTAKNGWYASQILRAIKRIEAMKINKYLNPGYFFWVAIDPRMILSVKIAPCSSFKTLIGSRSPRPALNVKAKSMYGNRDVIRIKN
jgi:hypothetical protein